MITVTESTLTEALFLPADIGVLVNVGRNSIETRWLEIKSVEREGTSGQYFNITGTLYVRRGGSVEVSGNKTFLVKVKK